MELRESLKTGEKQKQIWTSFPAFSNIWRSARAKDVNVNIRTSQFRRLRTLVSGISYLRLCVYHRHLDSFKASWKQYFFARPTRHDSARSWLLIELHLTNFPTYLLTYLQSRDNELLCQLPTWYIWQPSSVPTQTKWTTALPPIHTTHGAHTPAFTMIMKKPLSAVSLSGWHHSQRSVQT